MQEKNARQRDSTHCHPSSEAGWLNPDPLSWVIREEQDIHHRDKAYTSQSKKKTPLLLKKSPHININIIRAVTCQAIKQEVIWYLKNKSIFFNTFINFSHVILRNFISYNLWHSIKITKTFLSIYISSLPLSSVLCVCVCHIPGQGQRHCPGPGPELWLCQQQCHTSSGCRWWSFHKAGWGKGSWGQQQQVQHLLRVYSLCRLKTGRDEGWKVTASRRSLSDVE